MWKWILFFLILYLPLSAAEKVAFINLTNDAAGSLDNLKNKYDGKIIEIGGFLHQSADEQWTLDAQSSMRSCCITVQSKATLQLFLDQSFNKEKQNTRVFLTGALEIKPEYDETGNLTKIFHLRDTF